jgi:putative ABC transport system permease protein
VAATTAALTIGLTLMTLFTVIVSSAQASASQIDQHYPFDYVVQSNGGRAVPPGVVGALQSAPALGVVAAEYSRQAPVNGSRPR